MYQGIVLYYAAPGTSSSTLYTSPAGTQLRQILAINGSGAAAAVTVSVVRKDGSTVPIATAVSVAPGQVAELMANRLQSTFGYFVMNAGDALAGEQGTSSAVTLLAYGN